MKQKKLWIITLLLLIVHLFIQFFFESTNVIRESSNILNLVLNHIGTIIIIAIIGVGLGVTTAILPYKQKKFKDKFSITLPLSMLVVLILLILTFSYTIYINKVKGIELRPLTKYEDIQIPANLDCKSISIGKFETEKLYIERTVNKQIQINKKTGEKREFIIEWTNNCEYILTSTKDSSEKTNVKITAINSDHYSCYIISEKHKNKYPNYLTIKRIK